MKHREHRNIVTINTKRNSKVEQDPLKSRKKPPSWWNKKEEEAIKARCTASRGHRNAKQARMPHGDRNKKKEETSACKLRNLDSSLGKNKMFKLLMCEGYSRTLFICSGKKKMTKCILVFEKTYTELCKWVEHWSIAYLARCHFHQRIRSSN